MTKRGTFIVFEGLDRCGKSTQVARLEDSLREQGHRVRTQKFPDRTTEIGKMIDAYLKNTAEMDDRAIHLLFSANRWECASAIERDLKEGMSIIADRYAFSGIAFSAAKGLPFDWLLTPDRSLPSPDLTLYLTLPTSETSNRQDFGEERYESVSMQTRVREQFGLVRERVERGNESTNTNVDAGGKKSGNGEWVEVDASGTREKVQARIWRVINPVLEREKGEVGRLWVD
ncbi:hypothetical protein FFLO_01108 [Filobasidium floriforme]|uniref:Thymidylate kinase n=1 Tax=Filobasidium floriforme TaxID=5210 RepID=A0A8K0NQA9_9TREE|nr:hypothetical protein FFLO_01108 [Filobasidium floriforme]